MSLLHIFITDIKTYSKHYLDLYSSTLFIIINTVNFLVVSVSAWESYSIVLWKKLKNSNLDYRNVFLITKDMSKDSQLIAKKLLERTLYITRF